ncbi:MAG: signal peptide peptidase SppA, partial [Bacteroidota bacterium]
GLKPEIFKVGDFKSYVEPYLRTDMSEADRKQTSAYLNSIYDFYLSQVSESRNIPQDSLRSLSDNARVDTPNDAVKFGLIDGAIYEDSVFSLVREALEIEADDKINFITYGKYQNAPKTVTKKYSKTKVAVVFGEGAIGSGKSKQGESIGSETIVSELRKARKDENVKAIVLRINSPGGSALASDEMWREVQMVKKSGKPIIASMSNVAASGGYYMAMGCDRIVAQPNTITGSIGIFAILMDASYALEDNLGLTFDRVNTGQLSDLGSPTKAFSDLEKATLQRFIENGYDDFTKKAAKGRGMTQDDLKKIASGRVWTGDQALENGLIDEFGDLDHAITLAAEAAELGEDYSVSYRPKVKGVLEELLGGGFAQAQAEKEIKAQLGPLAPYWQEIKTISEMQGLQARLPYEIRIVSKMRVQK